MREGPLTKKDALILTAVAMFFLVAAALNYDLFLARKQGNEFTRRREEAEQKGLQKCK